MRIDSVGTMNDNEDFILESRLRNGSPMPFLDVYFSGANAMHPQL